MSQLQFYNTPHRTVEPFTPLTPGRVTLYTCGPTVYDYPTIGNWTAYVYWDILVRVLTAHELEVERVMNITDVGHLTSDADEGEDKLEKGAKRDGKTAWDVAKFYTEDFLAGMEALNLIRPTHITKATEYIDEQIELVRILHKKGYTYQIDDGIYFDTSKFPSYADFAQLDIEAQKAGARVEYNTEKRNPSDFALWKFTPAGQVRDMQWETPQDLLTATDDIATPVMGFPGWHLECSAMAASLLGDTLDIHTGGIDHIRVHHTNEIAQSVAAHDAPLSRFWLHTNHLKSDGTKISKSLGNGYTLSDIEARGYSPEDLRMSIIQAHYQSEGNFTFKNLQAASQRLHNWRRAAVLRHQIHTTLEDSAGTVPSFAASQALTEILADNLATPDALAHVDKVFSEVLAATPSRINKAALTSFVEHVDAVLGFQLMAATPDISDQQKQMILARTRARENKEWATSDKLRDELIADGIVLRDAPTQVLWEYAPATHEEA